jgi:hypothetical protein
MSASTPLLDTVANIPLRSKSHGAGCWATASCRSATLIMPCRWTGSAFSNTRYESEPSPWPDVWDVNVIQETGEVADHAQSRDRLIVIVEDPPAGGNELVGVFTAASHLVLVGAVTLVDAELPQAIAAPMQTIIRNSRAGRKLTCLHMQKPRRPRAATACRRLACYTEVLQRNTIE